MVVKVRLAVMRRDRVKEEREREEERRERRGEKTGEIRRTAGSGNREGGWSSGSEDVGYYRGAVVVQ